MGDSDGDAGPSAGPAGPATATQPVRHAASASAAAGGTEAGTGAASGLQGSRVGAGGAGRGAGGMASAAPVAGLALAATEDVQRLLETAGVSSRVVASTGLTPGTSHDCVPWSVLRAAWVEVRSKGRVGSYQPPPLAHLLRRTRPVFPEPPRAAPPDAEAEARRARLRAEYEERQYQAMVAGVTVEERRANEMAETQFGEYRSSLSFGANVILSMLTFYVMFYYLGKGISSEPAVRYLMGCLGIMLALVIDTALLITRETYPASKRQAFRAKYHEIDGPRFATHPDAPGVPNLAGQTSAGSVTGSGGGAHAGSTGTAGSVVTGSGAGASTKEVSSAAAGGASAVGGAQGETKKSR